MRIQYQKRTLVPLEDVGQPDRLPHELRGLADETLADLGAALDPCPPRFVNVGFFPVEVFDLSEEKQAKRREIDAAYDARRQGFPCTLGGRSESLQLRDGTNDARNWQVLQRRAEKRAAAGQGTTTSPVPVRCDSNREYTLTYAELVVLMEQMEDYGAAIMVASWRKKDQVRAASTVAEVQAIDANSGWPGG